MEQQNSQKQDELLSLSESLDRGPKLLELGPSSSEYRPALPVRRAAGEKPLSQEIRSCWRDSTSV